LCRHRLAPQVLTRALTQAEPFSAADAVTAGFFDRVVPQEELLKEAQATARRLAELDRRSWVATKVRLHEKAWAAVRGGFEADRMDGVERGIVPST
jgi:enoyl-CoA hydratase